MQELNVLGKYDICNQCSNCFGNAEGGFPFIPKRNLLIVTSCIINSLIQAIQQQTDGCNSDEKISLNSRSTVYILFCSAMILLLIKIPFTVDNC